MKLLKLTTVHHHIETHWFKRSINKVVCRRNEAVLCPKIKPDSETDSRCSARTINLIILTLFSSWTFRFNVLPFFFVCLALANSPASKHKKRSKQPTYEIKEKMSRAIKKTVRVWFLLLLLLLFSWRCVRFFRASLPIIRWTLREREHTIMWIPSWNHTKQTTNVN